MPQNVTVISWEKAIKQVKAVVAVRIKTNSQDDIEEVHILADSSRSPKQIVRDVESVLAAQYGLEFDHKKISVAQVGYEDEDAEDVKENEEAGDKQFRPLFVGVSIQSLQKQSEVKVVLRVAGENFTGIASGLSTSRNHMRLFVEATIDALNTFNKYLIVVEDVSTATLGRHTVVMVSVTLITSAGEQVLVGSAILKNDYGEAVVKATLDAMNRRLVIIRNQNE